MKPKNSKIGIIGSFGFGKLLRDGQTIKTQQLSKLLESQYCKADIVEIDTHGWKRNPFKLFWGVVEAVRRCDKVIMLPAQGAVKIIPRLSLAFKKRSTKLFYDVIGGWLPEYLDDKPRLKNSLKKLDGIWVETTGMKKKLDKRGFQNTSVVPNFKDLNILTESEVQNSWNKMNEGDFVFTMFSRVTKEKGVEDAIDVISRFNNDKENQGIRRAFLKIYGQVPESYRTEFNKLVENHKDYVEYAGLVSPEQSTRVLQESFMLLFPTHYPGEGFPGTIIDAYASGVPVIASDWRYNGEIVIEGETGFLYPVHDNEAFYKCLVNAISDLAKISTMRSRCLQEAAKYTKEAVSSTISHLLN